MSAPLTIKDNNKSVDAQVGNAITIHLDGNPTTGFAWTRAGFEGQKSLSDEHVEVVSKYEPTPAAAGLIGAGGVYKVSVIPKHPGQHTVSLVYARSFESPKPDNKTFTVNLNAE